MLEKTSGIVLNQIKYTDSGIVVQVFTSRFGCQSFMIKGLRNKKSGIHASIFRPLTILDMVIYFRESRSMQSLKEATVQYSPSAIYGNILKSTTAIFLGEVLTSLLREEGEQEEMFTYIRDSVIYFDSRKEEFSNFHIAFLTGLCSFLGFEPGRRTDPEKKVFDLLNGTFVEIPPAHGVYSGTGVSEILSGFFESSWDDMNQISLSGQMRNEVLSELLRYYAVHIPSLGRINSLEVLREVFK